MERRFYIAYGSNLNVQQMRFRCPDARPVGTGVIEGFELLFKGSLTGSYLTIEEHTKGKVQVAVWAVSGADEARLDRYEGYPAFYYKKEMEIPVKDLHSETVRKLKCFVYVMHEDRPFGVPTWQYVHTCIEGYRDFGFDARELFRAIEKSRRLSNGSKREHHKGMPALR